MGNPSVIVIPFRRMPKLYLRVAITFPDPLSLLECSVCQVLVFRATLSSPLSLQTLSCRVYHTKMVHTEVY